MSFIFIELVLYWKEINNVCTMQQPIDPPLDIFNNSNLYNNSTCIMKA